MAFKLKSDLPSKSLFYITRVIGSKKMKSDAKEYKDYVEKCRMIGVQFAYFMNNEWIFDNPSVMKMQ